MGEIVSVNVADVRTVEHRGKEVRTGIFKLPVEGPVVVDEVGLQGDVIVDRRVHGGERKAVYAYASEDVRWWEQELDRELGPGFFGENLTLIGVDVSGARVGERWEAGGVVLEVTEPRLPCFKLAKKVGDARFQKRFVRAGRPGAYLRVVRPGELRAGDRVRVMQGAPDGAASVAELVPGAAGAARS